MKTLMINGLAAFVLLVGLWLLYSPSQHTAGASEAVMMKEEECTKKHECSGGGFHCCSDSKCKINSSGCCIYNWLGKCKVED